MPIYWKTTPPFGPNVEAGWAAPPVPVIFSRGIRLAGCWQLAQNRTNASLSPGPLAVRRHFSWRPAEGLPGYFVP